MSMRPVPASCPISQYFRGTFSSKITGGAGHGAVDFAAPTGTLVVAPDDMFIEFAGWAYMLEANSWEARWYQLRPAWGVTNQGGGLMIRGRNSLNSRQHFAHLSRLRVSPGQNVKKGEVIGEVGSTGSSTGPHLHYALHPAFPNWNNGYYGAIDPLPYLTEPYSILGATQSQTVQTIQNTSAVGTSSSAPKNTSNVKNFIDVSDWQPTSTIANVSTDAVSIKATEGSSWTSKNMAGHIAAARKKNIKYSLYHFSRSSQNSSEAESKHFLNVVKPYLSDPLLDHLVLDWEEDSQINNNAWAERFLRDVEKGAPNTRRAIYTRLAFLNGNGWTQFGKNHSIWLAWYGTSNTFNGYATDTTEPQSFRSARSNGWHISAWQYTDKGRLSGYNGNLDLNTTVAVQENMQLWSNKKEQTLLEWIMSNEDQVRKILREEIMGTLLWSLDPRNKNANLYAERLGKANLDAKISLEGRDKGKVSNLRTKAAWENDNFRTIEKKVDDLENTLDIFAQALLKLIQIDEERGEK